ncbi:hypothetical protein [Halorussus limi]|uniref:hypothetical protein n=1 Tax=Halorussus limi TaxID=2938695 RepID=UPI003F5E9368
MRFALIAGCTRTAEIAALATDLDLELTVTDPEFDRSDHPAMDAYVAGEAKEDVGMGGALALADRSDVSMAAVGDRVIDVYEPITDEEPAVKP